MYASYVWGEASELLMLNLSKGGGVGEEDSPSNRLLFFVCCQFPTLSRQCMFAVFLELISAEASIYTATKLPM